MARQKREPVAADPAADGTVEVDMAGAPAEKVAEVAVDAGAEDALAKLQADLDAERKARAAAEAAAAAAESRATTEGARATQAKTAAQQAAYGELITGLEKAKLDATNAEGALAAAYKRADWDAVAKMQREVVRAEQNLAAFERGKDEFDSWLKRQQDAPDTSNIEGRLAAANLTEPTKAWFRKHPEYLMDTVKNGAAQRAHFKALGEGLQPDTKAYFDFCEDVLGLNGNGHDKSTQDQVVDTGDDERPAPRASAPPTRHTESLRPAGRKIALTPEQVEAAQMSGSSPAQYAKQLQKLVEEGKLPPTAIRYVQ